MHMGLEAQSPGLSQTAAAVSSLQPLTSALPWGTVSGPEDIICFLLSDSPHFLALLQEPMFQQFLTVCWQCWAAHSKYPPFIKLALRLFASFPGGEQLLC